MSSAKHTKNDFFLEFDPIFAVLQGILGITHYKELAEKLNIGGQAVSNARKKGAMPVKWIHQLAGKGLISWDRVGQIVSGGGRGGDGPGEKRGPDLKDDGGAKTFAEGRDVAGEGVEAEIPIPYGTGAGVGRYRVLIELLQRWVDEAFPLSQRAGLRAWIVDEDNMEPTIPRKSVLLIDSQDRNLMAKGIFAFRTNGHLTIMRTFPHGDGVNIDLVNDNRAYPSCHLPESNLVDGPGSLRVFGRVIFKGNKI